MEFIASMEKFRDMTKTQILDQDTVIKLSSSREKTKLFAYNIQGNNYAIFSFTNKNELIFVDYVTFRNGKVVSITYPEETKTD